MSRPMGEQRVERIEADGGAAERSGELGQSREIGEIADAPVARRAQTVKLRRDAPETKLRIGAARRQIAMIGRDDERQRSRVAVFPAALGP